LSASIPSISKDVAYMAGLFQNAGALVFHQIFSDYSVLYRKSFSHPLSILEIENEEYGTNHAVIGYLFAKHWKLPDLVCSGIYCSHAQRIDEIPGNDIRALVAMLKIATNTVGNFVFPEDMAESEAVLSVSDAYIEIMADANGTDLRVSSPRRRGSRGSKVPISLDSRLRGNDENSLSQCHSWPMRLN
jgi:HD-like signal output (HDOD) protein